MLNGFCNVAIDRDLTNDILKSLNDLAKKMYVLGFLIAQNMVVMMLVMLN